MYNNLTATLLAEVEKIANEKYSGHYTVLKFSTNFKGFFGTPDGYNLRDALEQSSAFKSINDLLYAMANNPVLFDTYKIDDRVESIKNKKVSNLEDIRNMYR